VGYDEFVQTRNISKEITIAQNAQLVVNLASNPSTGFSWTPAAIVPSAVLAQTDTKYVAPGGNMAGATGTQVLTFKASEKGVATVTLEYSRPWEGGEKAEWTFRLRVTVQ
jgi:predicted secreted protein